jgi:hypothetical protein
VRAKAILSSQQKRVPELPLFESKPPSNDADVWISIEAEPPPASVYWPASAKEPARVAILIGAHDAFITS